MDNVVEAIRQAAEDFADRLSGLTSEPYFREAVVKTAIREMAWALSTRFPEQLSHLHEQLDVMAGLLEEEGRNLASANDAQSAR